MQATVGAHSASRCARRKTGNRHIALLIEQANEYTRGILRGFQTYMNRKETWSLFLGDPDWIRGGSIVDSDRFDGILALVTNHEIAYAIRSSGLPAVDLSSAGLLPELPCVYADDESVARLGASHLLERGYKSLAYCGNQDSCDSASRGQSFVHFVEQQGLTCSLLSMSRIEMAASWVDGGRRMVDWMASLPKPLGIFVSDDTLGQRVLEACLLAGLSVPQEVGVISVGNDSLLCGLSAPPLSSIAQDTASAGYRAAALLDRMMNGERIEHESYPIEPLGVVARLSTDAAFTRDSLVSDAVRFIRSHAHRDINVEDVLQHFHISRRALEMRFRKALGQTPHEEILDTKLQLVKQLLADYGLTLPMVAERAGYKHSEYMSAVFKKRFGVTPGEYRRQCRESAL
ncbi:Xylose operon regulatory protein [compost metagenome]